MENIFEKYLELLRNKQALNATRELQKRILGQSISLEVLIQQEQDLKEHLRILSKEESLWCIMKTRHRKTPYSMFCCYAPLDDNNYKTNPKFVFVGTHEECVRKLEELNTENT